VGASLVGAAVTDGLVPLNPGALPLGTRPNNMTIATMAGFGKKVCPLQ